MVFAQTPRTSAAEPGPSSSNCSPRPTTKSGSPDPRARRPDEKASETNITYIQQVYTDMCIYILLICIYIYIYNYVCIYSYVYIYTHLAVCMYIYISICVYICLYISWYFILYILYLHWDIPNPSPSPRSTNAQPSRPSRGHTALRPSAWSPYASSGASWWKLGSSSRENAKKGLVFAAKLGFFRENSRDFIGIYDKKTINNRKVPMEIIGINIYIYMIIWYSHWQ